MNCLRPIAFLVVFIAFHCTANAEAPPRITDFELTDQNSKTRTYKFPKSKVSVMTVADHKGSAQLEPWIEALYARYQKRIDIDGIADVSKIPKPLQSIFRAAFRKQLNYSVMLDWGGSVVKQFDFTKAVANVYVIDRQGRIVQHVSGPMDDQKAKQLFAAIDKAS